MPGHGGQPDGSVSDADPFGDPRVGRAVSAALETDVRFASPSQLLALLSLDLTRFGAGVLDGLEQLHNLRSLYADGCDITDVQPLTGLSLLKHLVLSDNPGLSDLSALGALGLLQVLNLAGTAVVSLLPLAALKKMEFLTVDRTRVSDLSVVEHLPLLSIFSAAHTSVCDIRPLRHASALVELDLAHTDVVDVSPLAALPRLHLLNLVGTRVTDVSALEEAGHVAIRMPDGSHRGKATAQVKRASRRRALEETAGAELR